MNNAAWSMGDRGWRLEAGPPVSSPPPNCTIAAVFCFSVFPKMHHRSSIPHPPFTSPHCPSPIIRLPPFRNPRPSSSIPLSLIPSLILKYPSLILNYPSLILHYPSLILHDPSRILHYASSITHPSSSIPPSLSSILHPLSSIHYPLSSTTDLMWTGDGGLRSAGRRKGAGKTGLGRSRMPHPLLPILHCHLLYLHPASCIPLHPFSILHAHPPTTHLGRFQEIFLAADLCF